MTKKILVIGDVILDRYTYVKTERMCPDAPVPVWDEIRHESRLGGAANVAANLASLAKDQDAEVWLAGVVSNDVRFKLIEAGINTDLCSTSRSIIKHRYVDVEQMKILGRFDNVKKLNEGEVELFEEMFSELCDLSSFDAVIFSDYRIGTISDEFAKRVCSEVPDRIFVDSKRKDLSIYEGSYVFKLNESEYSAQVSSNLYTNVERLCKFCVVTQGASGASLLQGEVLDEKRYIVHSEMFPIDKVKAVDVTGCGDTFIASLVYYCTVQQNDLRKAVKFANFCSMQVVQKFGTSVVKL